MNEGNPSVCEYSDYIESKKKVASFFSCRSASIYALFFFIFYSVFDSIIIVKETERIWKGRKQKRESKKKYLQKYWFIEMGFMFSYTYNVAVCTTTGLYYIEFIVGMLSIISLFFPCIDAVWYACIHFIYNKFLFLLLSQPSSHPFFPQFVFGSICWCSVCISMESMPCFLLSRLLSIK